MSALQLLSTLRPSGIACQHGASRLLSTLRAYKALASQHFSFSRSSLTRPRTTNCYQR